MHAHGHDLLKKWPIISVLRLSLLQFTFMKLTLVELCSAIFIYHPACCPEIYDN